MAPDPQDGPVMESNLTRYIWNHTRRQQIWILCIVLLSMIPYYMSFDLPKQIVNGPIQGEGFATPDAVQRFMPLSLDLPFIGQVSLTDGVDLNRMQTLMGLSLLFLMLVIVNGIFKFYINTYKGRLGERLLRRIRFELVDRVLRFPPARFRGVKGAEVSSMIKDEIEPLGGFTGDAFVQPVLLGGQAIAALSFIFVQNLWLGLIAAAMAAFQVGLIPQMRRRLIELGRQRQLTARRLAGRVGEIVEGIDTIHALDTSNFERADMADRLGTIFQIRYDFYQWKYLVKFINNFLSQLTPFLFYAIGGYFTIRGTLDVGQLVAVINAYKDLPGPLKELIDWDQARQDVQVKYEQVVDQFRADDLLPAERQALSAETGPLPMPLNISGLTITSDTGVRLLAQVSLQVQPGETIAMIDDLGSGAETLAAALGRKVAPAGGRIAFGQTDLWELPESVSGRRITYVGADSFIFHGSLRDNLLYGLKHAPVVPAEDTPAHRDWTRREARASANPDFDIRADWINHDMLPFRDHEGGLTRSMISVFDAVRLDEDLVLLVMRSTLDPDKRPHLARALVDIRHELRAELDRSGQSQLVTPFDIDTYNVDASILENLMFSALADPGAIAVVMQSSYARNILVKTGLIGVLFDIGRGLAENIVEIFGDLAPDDDFFDEMPFLTAESIPVYQQLLQRTRDRQAFQVSRADAVALIELASHYIEPRFRMGLLTPEIMQQLVAARGAFLAGLPEDLRGLIEPFDPERFNRSASIAENILFGKIRINNADAQAALRAITSRLVEQHGIMPELIDVGLDYDLGAGGRRFSQLQRQKLNLARALMRRSDMYVFNRPLSGTDQRMQEAILADSLALIRSVNPEATVIWTLSNPALASKFERIIVFDQGRIVSDGNFETVAKESSIMIA